MTLPKLTTAQIILSTDFWFALMSCSIFLSLIFYIIIKYVYCIFSPLVQYLPLFIPVILKIITNLHYECTYCDFLMNYLLPPKHPKRSFWQNKCQILFVSNRGSYCFLASVVQSIYQDQVVVYLSSLFCYIHKGHIHM